MSSSKIGVIVRHEFLTRIRSKAFLLATLLTPLGMIALIAIPIIASINSKDDSAKRVAVVDKTGSLAQRIVMQDSSLFFASDASLEELEQKTRNKKITGYIVIPEAMLTADTMTMYSLGGGGFLFYEKIESAVRKVVRRERLQAAGMDSLSIARLEKGIAIKNQKLSEKGVEKDSGEALALVGYAMGFFIYMMMFIYGSIVMRAVLEEKTNRIVEVLASSAKPFEIMMGKIIGVGAVGLVQVILWVSCSLLLQAIAAPLVMKFAGAHNPQEAIAMLQASKQTMPQMVFHLPDISPWLIVGFVFYFLSGYFMYATLFAGIAAAADQEQDMQTLQLPVTLPLIIPMLFIGNIIQAPDGSLATVLSMIPFFTPTIMMVRIAATSVPLWQIILSSLLIVATFVGSVWVAGRVYRVGILSYGKKASFKDIGKWLFTS